MLREKWESLRVPREKVVSFWAQFSRAEFALKAAGFARGDRHGVASTNWETFGREVAQNLGANQSESLVDALRYISEHPPRRQIFRDGRAYFEQDATRSHLPSEIERALVYVRRARNNLFHGGKYFNEDEANRDERLIDAAMVILEASIRAIGDVWLAYDTGDA